MKNYILLVDDAKEIKTLVNHSLAGPLMHIDWAKNCHEAQEMIKKTSYDLVLLDVELPDGSGFDLAKELQTNSSSTAIFFLSSHKDLSEKMIGFSVGADDYITKPFDPMELKVRVESKLKKQEVEKTNADLMIWRELRINKSSQEVAIFAGDDFKPVDLTSLEFKLLVYMASRPGEVIQRDQILNDIWGEDVHVYSRSVDTHVSKLRKKLADSADIIESVHGTGYKFNPTSVTQRA